MDLPVQQDNKVTEVLEQQNVSGVVEDLPKPPEQSPLLDTPISEDNDALDIDLSDLEIASKSNLDDPDLIIPESLNETYKNIMTVCNATTETIKQTISDILNSRENVVIGEIDPTAELQESLNKKIADFERVVGCFTVADSEAHPISDEKNSQSSSVVITEVENSEKHVEEKSEVVNASNDTQKDIDLKNGSEIFEEKTVLVKPDAPVDFAKSSAKQPQPLSSKEVIKNISVEEEKSTKKHKASSSSKKKGDKTIDQVMKSLGNGTTEDKLQILCKKHLEALEETRSSEQKVKQFERQIIAQQREKEQLQADHNRMILAKSRLEGLCREMQRQSKAVKEESLLRIKEEEDRRREVANKFQSTLNDIIALNQEVSKKNLMLREENAELATKLKSLVDNYEVWETNMSKMVQQKELEAQLAKAKHAKVNLLLKQETEKFLREKQSLLENLSELQKRCTMLATNELKLRSELGDYTTKYDEFQTVLNNSSKVFASFKTDMDNTSKKIRKLEKETSVYKHKWECSNKALLDLTVHKEKQDKEYQNAKQRILTLEKLCRALQAERNELQNQLNITTPSSISAPAPEVPLAPEAETA